MTDTNVVAAKEILALAFDLNEADIPEDAALDNFEPWDSLGHIQVLSSIEAMLKRELQTEESIGIINLQTLQETLNSARMDG